MQPHRGIFQYNKIYQRVQALCIFNAQNLWALTLCCSCSSVLITYILHKSQHWCIWTTVIELTRNSDHYGACTLEELLQCSWHFKRCPLLQQQFATIANWKHRQRHNGPKALSTLTHTTPLIQSRNFKKLPIFGQISASFYLTKSRKHIKQLLTNLCTNLKSMFWQIHITI